MPKEEGPSRALPDSVLAALIGALDQLEAGAGRDVRLAVRVLIETGRRPAEICKLPCDCQHTGSFDPRPHLPRGPHAPLRAYPDRIRPRSRHRVTLRAATRGPTCTSPTTTTVSHPLDDVAADCLAGPPCPQSADVILVLPAAGHPSRCFTHRAVDPVRHADPRTRQFAGHWLGYASHDYPCLSMVFASASAEPLPVIRAGTVGRLRGRTDATTAAPPTRSLHRRCKSGRGP